MHALWSCAGACAVHRAHTHPQPDAARGPLCDSARPQQPPHPGDCGGAYQPTCLGVVPRGEGGGEGGQRGERGGRCWASASCVCVCREVGSGRSRAECVWWVVSWSLLCCGVVSWLLLGCCLEVVRLAFRGASSKAQRTCVTTAKLLHGWAWPPGGQDGMSQNRAT